MSSSGDAWSSAIDDLIARVREACEDGTTAGAEAVALQARRNASGRPGPEVEFGALTEGIQSHPADADSDNSFRAEIVSSVVYARAQELGAVIVPEHAQFLRFVGRYFTSYDLASGLLFEHPIFGAQSPEGFVYASEVTLPPRPYLGPALDVGPRGAGEEVQRVYADAYTSALEG